MNEFIITGGIIAVGMIVFVALQIWMLYQTYHKTDKVERPEAWPPPPPLNRIAPKYAVGQTVYAKWLDNAYVEGTIETIRARVLSNLKEVLFIYEIQDSKGCTYTVTEDDVHEDVKCLYDK